MKRLLCSSVSGMVSYMHAFNLFHSWVVQYFPAFLQCKFPYKQECLEKNPNFLQSESKGHSKVFSFDKKYNLINNWISGKCSKSLILNILFVKDIGVFHVFHVNRSINMEHMKNAIRKHFAKNLWCLGFLSLFFSQPQMPGF